MVILNLIFAVGGIVCSLGNIVTGRLADRARRAKEHEFMAEQVRLQLPSVMAEVIEKARKK